MLARKPITALMVSASSFLPAIKVLSIVSFLFQIRLIFFRKVWNMVAQSCHTYSFFASACGILLWAIKMQTTINHFLKYNESMTETCSDVLKKAFHKLRGYIECRKRWKRKKREINRTFHIIKEEDNLTVWMIWNWFCWMFHERLNDFLHTHTD